MKLLLFLLILLFINSVGLLTLIVYERKKPEKSIAWIFIALLIPIVGLILYVVLGRDWKHRRLEQIHSSNFDTLINHCSEKHASKDFNKFITLFSYNSDSPLFLHNDITIFKDGIEKFKHLEEEILKAKHHIHLSYYTVRDDELGSTIKDLLVLKAREGIKIRFIMDGVGSIKLKKSYINELCSAGIEVVQCAPFLPSLMKYFDTHSLYRNHRKIVIIDGTVGFVGGINIGNEYVGKSKYGYWRDTHLKIRGEFVFGLQETFINHFNAIKEANGKASFSNENMKCYFPPSDVENIKMMQLVRSGPDTKFFSIMQGVLKMIAVAEDHIYITTPYFVPPQGILESLKMAAMSGVDVRILFPTKWDQLFMHYGSLPFLSELLQYGVKIYLYDKNSFVHAKTICIDGKLCTVGSTNMDMLSLEYNYEVNAVIYDSDVTKELERLFLEDLQRSTIMDLNYGKNSPRYLTAFQTICRVLSGLL